MIRSGFIHDCPVTVKDVEMANKIYGTAISHLKGKSTKKTPNALVDEMFTLPTEIILPHIVLNFV